MSASLVGSEMCIRDSHWGPCPDGEWALMAPVVRSARTIQLRCPAYSIPVSYTHLTLPTICSV
eukprot:10674792-Alexandrium_andersonii.AAC.1